MARTHLSPLQQVYVMEQEFPETLRKDQLLPGWIQTLQDWSPRPHRLVKFQFLFGPWAAQMSPSTWLLLVPLLSPLHKKAAWGSPMDGLLKMGTGDLTPTGGSSPYLIWMGDDTQAAPFSGGLTEGHSSQHHRGPQRFTKSCAYFPYGLSSPELTCSWLAGTPWSHLPSQLLALGSLSQVTFRSHKKLSVAHGILWDRTCMESCMFVSLLV